MFKSVRNLVLGLWLVMLAACGGGDAPTQPGPEELPPNPEGTLLEGAPQEQAREALLDLPPSPATGIVDGLLADRLIAVLDPGAAVGDVNAALESSAARIVSMRSGNPFVTLKIPESTNRQAIETLAGDLQDSGAFLIVRPAAAILAEPTTSPTSSKAVLPESGLDAIGHLVAAGFPAAWNAAPLAEDNNDKITVLVPDEYSSTLPHGEIDAQDMAGFGAPNPLPGPTVYPGNHGYVVAGIIGANFDDTPATGTSPDPTQLLDIVSLPIGGLTWVDIFWLIGQRLATSGDRFVLNTSIGYNDPVFTTWSRFDRALHVLSWRTTAALHYSRYVHVSSAGEGDTSDLNSPFIAAARFDDVREMLESPTEEEETLLDAIWLDYQQTYPLATALANNVIVVEAGNPNGTLASFSAPGDLRALGVNLTGPCRNADPGSTPGSLCDGELAVYSGTGVATAMVSGLAAYLMNLSDRSAPEIRTHLLSVYSSSGGMLDAYRSVLGLDGVNDAGAVKTALFDVAGVEPVPGDDNGKFDENDLKVFLGFLASNVKPVGGGGSSPGPYSRYDLNGDGITGGDANRALDLDGDGAFTAVSQSIGGAPFTFDENLVRDMDALCFYAYSDLYEGDPEIRDQLLASVHGGVFVEAEFPEVIEPGVAVPITIRAGINVQGVITYLDGVEIDVYASDGTVETEDGVTAGGGIFTTTIALDEDYNDTDIEVDARFESGERVEWEQTSRRPNKIEFLGRDSEVQAWVSSSYTASPGDDLSIVFDHGTNEEIDDIPGGFIHDFEETDSREVNGSTWEGKLRARQNSDVYTINGDEFTGTFFSGAIEGKATLLGPDQDLEFYQSWVGGYSEHEVEFVVWGEPATYNLVGSLNTPVYSVGFFGRNVSLNCHPSGDQPPGSPAGGGSGTTTCSSISESGVLEPGEYSLRIRISMSGTVQNNCPDDPDPWDPPCTTSGNQEFDGNIQVTLDVSHPSS